jgi:NTP pyrophosphatase (non-canonical NTP hydrolase)|tara:strand:+ start:8436 stop:8804 length:369 start_codon:yes stop_codon:yes gene_type:complete
MITQEDIDAFISDNPTVGASPMEYSYWVEGKIMTGGESRLFENVLGLVGEAGEIAEKTKKLIRDNATVKRGDMIKELGDVLFYVTALANHFDSNLSEVIQTNMDKLNSRASRGVLSGNGDNR